MLVNGLIIPSHNSQAPIEDSQEEILGIEAYNKLFEGDLTEEEKEEDCEDQHEEVDDGEEDEREEHPETRDEEGTDEYIEIEKGQAESKGERGQADSQHVGTENTSASHPKKTRRTCCRNGTNTIRLAPLPSRNQSKYIVWILSTSNNMLLP
jgi:hypothetical protein